MASHRGTHTRRKRLVAGSLLFALATACTAVGVLVWQQGSSSATTSATFPVPAHVRRKIAHRYSKLAYLPTLLPRRVHYASWYGVSGFSFTVLFSGTGSASQDIQYTVLAGDCKAQGSPMLSFTLNGLQVLWSGEYTDQHAWRCVTRNGTSLIIQAGRSVPGDANPIGGSPTLQQRRHALVLAKVVAYARPIP
jgi:hypothetical protein